MLNKSFHHLRNYINEKRAIHQLTINRAGFLFFLFTLYNEISSFSSPTSVKWVSLIRIMISILTLLVTATLLDINLNIPRLITALLSISKQTDMLIELEEAIEQARITKVGSELNQKILFLYLDVSIAVLKIQFQKFLKKFGFRI
jgi:Leucine-rich repeat (LRR) protein